MNPSMAGFRGIDPLTRKRMIVNAACLLIALMSVAIAAWVLISGQIGRQGIDALFLVLVCLLFAFAFGLPPLQAWREGQFQDFLRRRKANTPEPPEAQ